MTTRPIKLGLALLGQGPVSEMIDQARRAGLSKESILNHYPWEQLEPLLRR